MQRINHYQKIREKVRIATKFKIFKTFKLINFSILYVNYFKYNLCC